ncbi:MAG: hypothetical protein HYZ27_04600, partial [Deltaproteobacteria bacterium]|nr:hypothetical protein [Deltaproteobacteria bacterium]
MPEDCWYANPNLEGTLGCNPDCTFDISACVGCGNDRLEAGELCDGPELGSVTCPWGTLACAANCTTYDLALCSMSPICGDGQLDPSEACEGADPGAVTCESLGFPNGGTASCSSCVISSGACVGENCADVFDNDGNSQADCADLACSAVPACQPGPGAALGAPCDSHDDCASRLCLSEAATPTNAFGTCSRFCTSDAECGGGVCDAMGWLFWGLPVCYPPCILPADPSDCRAGYTCDDWLGTGPFCLGFCTTDSDCASGVCDPSTSFCGPQGERCGDGVDDDGDGAIDCRDVDCTAATHCRPGVFPDETWDWTLHGPTGLVGSTAGAPWLAYQASCGGSPTTPAVQIAFWVRNCGPMGCGSTTYSFSVVGSGFDPVLILNSTCSASSSAELTCVEGSGAAAQITYAFPYFWPNDYQVFLT